MIEKSFNTGLMNLNYAEECTGNGLPLLLLHGLTGNLHVFRSLFPVLANQRSVYALDLRGHGKSDRAQLYRIHDYMPDVISFIGNQVKNPVIIFGHSFGGMLGIMIAAKHPELVKALIIGDAILSKEFHREISNTMKDTLIFWREMAKKKSIETIMFEMKKRLVSIPGQEELISADKVFDEKYFRFVAYTLAHADPEILTAVIDHFEETYAEYQPDRLLPKIQCEVLILQANPERGGMERDEDVEKAMSLLSNAHHVKLNNVGHGLYLEDKDSVINTVCPFLKSLSTPVFRT